MFSKTCFALPLVGSKQGTEDGDTALFVWGCPDEGDGFGLLDEGVFAGDVGFERDIGVGDEIGFELGVFLCLGWVGEKIVSEGEVSDQVRGAYGEGVDVVGSGVLGVGFAEVAAGLNAKLAHDFVAEGFDGRAGFVKPIERGNFDQDVDDGFGKDIGDRGAADVVDGDRLIAESLAKVGLLLGEESFPLWVVWDGDWWHEWMICGSGGWGSFGRHPSVTLRVPPSCGAQGGAREPAHCPLLSSQNGSHPRSRMTLRVAMIRLDCLCGSGLISL